MPPIICIVGQHNSGKTTLLERLVVELKERGYRVATVKHNIHGFDIDAPGKDSWRLAQAGSDAVVLSSPDKLALIKSVERDSSLDDIARLLRGEFDIIIAEGYKESKAPKVEVHRKEIGGELLSDTKELMAIATDDPQDTDTPQYSLDDAPGIADLIEQRYLIGREEEQIALFINEAQVPLSPFPRDFIMKTLLAMVSALKGVESVESLDIWLKKKA